MSARHFVSLSVAVLSGVAMGVMFGPLGMFSQDPPVVSGLILLLLFCSSAFIWGLGLPARKRSGFEWATLLLGGAMLSIVTAFAFGLSTRHFFGDFADRSLVVYLSDISKDILVEGIAISLFFGSLAAILGYLSSKWRQS